MAALHPDAMANEDFVERCEELWFQRRERDFALGLSLPEFVPRPNVPPPKPTKVEKPTASIPVPVSIAPIKSTGPPAWLDEVDSAGSSGASSSLRTAPIPFSPLPSKPVGASSLTNSTVEESKDRRKISSSTGGAGSAEGSRQDATERKRGRSRSRSRSRSRERKSARNRSMSPPGATRGFDATVRGKNERSREREKEKRERDTVDKDKVRDRERDKQRDRDREKDRDKERDRDSKRSKRAATPTAPSPSTVEPAGHSHESSSRLNGQRHTEPSTSASVSASTLYHEDQSRPRHPEPNDSVPAFVTKGLHTVYIRSIDRRASLSDLNSFLLSTHQVGPIALRITRGTSNLSYAFAVYTAKEDAEMVMARLGGRLFYGVPVEVRPAHEPRPYHGQTGSGTFLSLPFPLVDSGALIDNSIQSRFGSGTNSPPTFEPSTTRINWLLGERRQTQIFDLIVPRGASLLPLDLPEPLPLPQHVTPRGFHPRLVRSLVTLLSSLHESETPARAKPLRELFLLHLVASLLLPVKGIENNKTAEGTGIARGTNLPRANSDASCVNLPPRPVLWTVLSFRTKSFERTRSCSFPTFPLTWSFPS